MIQEFFSSWELFQISYLSGWFIAILLSITGFLVVSRNQIFYGAAISQSSTFGIAFGLWLSSLPWAIDYPWLKSNFSFSFLAIFFSILAAFIMARGGKKGRESHEAITGWVFLLAASGSILLVSHSPHGLEEVHRLLSSSIIGATKEDLFLFALFSLIAILFIRVQQKPLLLFVMDPEMGASVGMRIHLWSVLTSLWLGIVVGLAIRSSGMLYTFGCLVLPGLCAKNISKELKEVFLKAPLFALVLAFLGNFLANYYDFPPAQLTIGLMCLALLFSWFYRSLSIKKI